MTAGGLLALAGLLLAVLLGSVSSQSDEWVDQLTQMGFWLAHIWLGLALCVGLQQLVNQLVSRSALRAWSAPGSTTFWLALGGTLASVLFAPFALLIEHLLAPFVAVDSEPEALSNGVLSALFSEWQALAVPFIVSWLLLNLGYRFYRQRPPQPAAEAVLVAPAPPASPAGDLKGGLLAKLPAALRHDLEVLEADLNYLRVRAAAGDALVLYSLARAAEELQAEGLQIHRRYWVAHRAVVSVRRAKQGLRVRVPDGRELPVSRRRQAEVIARYGTSFNRRSLSPS